MSEKVYGHRLIATRLGSGWAAVMLVEVKEDGKPAYTDVQQTGIGRYATEAEAIEEARQWAEADEVPFRE